MDPVVPLMMMWANNANQNQATPTVHRQRRRPRIFKPRLGLEHFSDAEIRHHFRLNKVAIEQIYEKLESNLDSTTKRTSAIPGMTKLMAGLHYFASGSFQYCVGAKLGMSQPTISRSLKLVVDAIVSLAPQYIRFPRTAQEIRLIREHFFRQAGFPNVVGLIDCTHIALLPPYSLESNFRNRKHFHSINVQVICGPNMEIMDVVARFPGSCHDAYILSRSNIGQAFETGLFGDALLLGDNGYRLAKWLMTPYLSPTNQAEEQYNSAHRRTRSQIERLFGILKSRFRCLDVTGGALLYNPIMVGKIIVSCCILQNIANSHHIEIDLATDLTEHISHQGPLGEDNNNEGRQRRRQITQAYFS